MFISTNNTSPCTFIEKRIVKPNATFLMNFAMLTHFCVHVLHFDSAGFISFGFENVRDVSFYPLYR